MTLPAIIVRFGMDGLELEIKSIEGFQQKAFTVEAGQKLSQKIQLKIDCQITLFEVKTKNETITRDYIPNYCGE